MTEAAQPQSERQRFNAQDLMRQLESLVPRVGPDGKEKGNRAALAALRRGLGKQPGEAPEMFPVLLPLLPEAGLSRWDERVAYLVASLFARYPDAPPWPESSSERWQRNLGASLRQLAAQTDSEGPERRFVALLNSDEDDLPHHLRGIVSLLESAKLPVPMDWVRLIWDLRGWNTPERTIQKDWAGAFWGGRRLQETTEEPAAEDAD